MPKKPQNPRKKALDAISRKVALFSVGSVYRDEEEARNLLDQAISLLDKAAELLVSADEKAAVSGD